MLKKEGTVPEGGLMCGPCEKTSSLAAAIASHMVSTHTDGGRKNVPCPVCDHAADYAKLVRHIMAVHSMEKVFSCDFCQKKFSTLNAKSRHVKKHSRKDMKQCCNCHKFYQLRLGSCRCCKK